jgi:hypothetical protein
MVEAYPSDNELLNIQSDSTTGIDYIPTGQAPYYLHFRKMLYRIILAFRRANELRVFDAGGLDIGVKAGAFWCGTEFITYEGSADITLADDKENIYIYLNADGQLVTSDYAGFPDMATTPNIRLAIVTTEAGDITSIADCRGGHNFVVPYASGGIKKTIEAHTQNDELGEDESGSIHTNSGATAAVTLLLPGSAQTGTMLEFAVVSEYAFCIAPGQAAIIDDSGQMPGKYKYANSIGASISLVADDNGNWITIAKHGIWSEEA